MALSTVNNSKNLLNDFFGKMPSKIKYLNNYDNLWKQQSKYGYSIQPRH